MGSGLQLVSTTAATGMPRRSASLTAMCSLPTSMMKSMSGMRLISRMPSRDFRYFSTARWIRASSFLESSATFSSSSRMASSSLNRSMDFLTVRKLVSMPPSHRLFT